MSPGWRKIHPHEAARPGGPASTGHRALVAVHAATHPAARLTPPPKAEPEIAPTADGLQAALDHEAEEDPEG